MDQGFSPSAHTPPRPKRRICTFQESWLLQADFKRWIKQDTDDTLAYCMLCNKKITIKHSGTRALIAHRDSAGHRKAEDASSCTSTAASFFPQVSGGDQDAIAIVELCSAYHGVMHSHSYLSTDCGTKLYSSLFPDSSIAKKVHCGKTKTEALVTGVLAPHSVKRCTTKLGDKRFALSTDASNRGNIKVFPIVISFFDSNSGIHKFLLDFYQDADETSAAIADRIRKSLTEHGLETANMVAYSADNASVNFGRHKSVFLNLRNDQASLIAAHCSCHLLHNAAKHGCKLLQFDVEVLALKVYSEFATAAKNVEKLKVIMEESEVQFQRVLRHVPTRWLSLYKAVDRLLQVRVNYIHFP